ncbi:MAG: SpoIIE family protein phosphatase [Terriglobales bacterium]
MVTEVQTSGTLSKVATRPVLRVFISSTAVDLREYRDKVRDAVLRLEDLPIAMETISAQSGQPASECMKMAAAADAVICVVAHRYGFVPPPELGGDGERSITWLEVDAAKRAGKRVFVFLLDPKAPWNEVKEQDRLTSEPTEKTAEIVKAVQKLKEFKAYLESEYTRSTFSSADHLAQLVTTALANFVPKPDRAPFNESARSAPAYYFAVQSKIIQEYTRTFVGREHAYQALASFLQNHRRGYFIVRAAPGQGKTAFSCHLIREAGYVHHLIHRTGGRNDSRLIVRSLAAQLLTLAETEQQLPESIPELTKTFEELLETVAARQGRIVILIDALDELPAEMTEEPPYLVGDILPDGAFFVVTSRPGARLDQLFERSFAIPHELYELGPLDFSEMREILQSRRPQITTAEVERIAESSQGNPLYLRAVADQLDSNPAYDLQTLPAGIEGFYRSATASLAFGNPILSGILGLLSVARTPLSVAQLSQIMSISQRDTDEQGITPIRQFLLEIDGSYTFYHARFHEFVTRTILYEDESRKAHRRIAHWLLLPANRTLEYRWASLAYHLFESGSFDELVKLIDEPFLAEKARRVGYAVLEDIELWSRVQLQKDDPALVERCVSLVESLRKSVGGDVLDFAEAIHPYQSGPKSFRTKLIAPSIRSIAGLDVYAGVLPKGEVAADFFEVIPADNRLVVAIGDAPSIGLKSAFVARFIGNLFHKFVAGAKPLHLGEVLARVNSTLAAQDYFERVSMQCVELDPTNGIVRMANAGHPYPVHYSSRRGQCDVLPLRGDLLHDRISDNSTTAPYEEYRVAIAPGDVIVLITDGLTEDHVMRGDPYGYRFTAIVEARSRESAETIGEAILDGWKVHPREDDAGDDVSVIVIRVTSGEALKGFAGTRGF